MELIVRSCVIDWIEETLTIVDAEEKTHVVPLDRNIHVEMIGYPDREERDMLARDLGAFMSKGYIIEKIVLEEQK